MAFINLKDLKANKGGQIKLTLQSNPVYQEREWANGKFNIFQYEVLKDGELFNLDATDSLKRKIDEKNLNIGHSFLLSFEEFTNKEGQLIEYWKVDKVLEQLKDAPVYETLKPEYQSGTNEFEERLKKDKAEKSKALNQQIATTNKTYTNGARFGMIFNNTVQLFIENGQSWTTPEFVKNFKRVETWVEACEQKPGTPQDPDYLEQKQRVDEYKQSVIDNTTEPVTVSEDELPF
jgi:hypothetical protein